MTETMDRKDNFSDEDHLGDDQAYGYQSGDGQLYGDQLHDDKLDDDQEIIELTDVLDGAVDDDDDDDDGRIDQLHSKAMSEKGMDLDDDIPLSDERIEDALLRIVEKKYAGKLDAIFVEAVERVVKREIETIKKSLLKDL
jgi:hypothetical protein